MPLGWHYTAVCTPQTVPVFLAWTFFIFFYLSSTFLSGGTFVTFRCHWRNQVGKGSVSEVWTLNPNAVFVFAPLGFLTFSLLLCYAWWVRCSIIVRCHQMVSSHVFFFCEVSCYVGEVQATALNASLSFRVVIMVFIGSWDILGSPL